MLLQLESIQKRFGGVTALHDGNLIVAAGEIHLLMGENGAGKSTLVKIIAGMMRRDAGRMLWRGQEVDLPSPAHAAAIGIAMVHQESLLSPHLTVAENLFLGREPQGMFGMISRRKMLERARHVIADHQFPLEADQHVSRLSPAEKQMVEICRAVLQGSSLLIFDEPTSSLLPRDSEQVFRLVRGLRERGMGVIYITHRLEELRAIGDNVTILRDGATIHTGPIAGITTGQLIERMVGRPVSATYARDPLTPGKVMLDVQNASSPKVRDISFQLREGEVLGVAGLMGSGRTELCNLLFGVDPLVRGSLHVDGQPSVFHSTRDAVQAGIALITEDRQRTGLAIRLPIAQNMTIANLPAANPSPFGRFGILNRTHESSIANGYIETLHIRCSSTKQPAGTLSGGNQQKVAITKWLFRKARIFLFDEPTRGIDIGAKREIFELIDHLAKCGAAILMVSSELQELQQLADRILVLRNGRLAGELPGTALQHEMMTLAALEQVA